MLVAGESPVVVEGAKGLPLAAVVGDFGPGAADGEGGRYVVEDEFVEGRLAAHEAAVALADVHRARLAGAVEQDQAVGELAAVEVGEALGQG